MRKAKLTKRTPFPKLRIKKINRCGYCGDRVKKGNNYCSADCKNRDKELY